MAVINLDKKELESRIGKITKNVEEKISMLGVVFESQDESNVYIDVPPNRPDMLSLQGFLRSYLSFIGKGSKKSYVVNPSKYNLTIKNELKEWPYALACVIKNIKFTDEKIKEAVEIQEKLAATMLRKRKKGGIGIYPLDKISFPITFTSMDSNKIKFRPLESDVEMSGKEILAKHPIGREYSYICHDWKALPVFTDAKGKIMSMPPIINSHDLGRITEDTKDIFIETTGIHLPTLKKVLNILAATFADMGGEIHTVSITGNIKMNMPDLTDEKITISLENVNKRLGLELNEKDIKNLLSKMNINYENKICSTPAYRADILHEVDIIEDIAIAYGYENFNPIIPNIATIGEESKEELLKRKIAEILTGLGLLETSSYSFTNLQEIKKTNTKKEDFIKIERSKSEFNILRENLASNSLKILSNNVDAEYPQNIFEIGTVFKKSNPIEESDSLVVSLCPSNFTKAKQVLEYLGKTLNITFALEPEKHSLFIEGRTASIMLNNKKIGYMGEINPSILKNWHIKMPIASFEISLDEIYKSLT